MTYDKQDLLLDLRKIAARLERRDEWDEEDAHPVADAALLRFIDDQQIAEAYEAIPKWYA